MPYWFGINDSRQVLRLQGAVTIRNVEELASYLGVNLDESQSLWLDANEIEDIDTAVLQLLLSLKRSTESLYIENPSIAFVAAVERSGLRRELLINAKEAL